MQGSPMGTIPPARAAVARQLALDAETAELVDAIRARRVEAVLLRGPAIARTLYADPARRSYDDIDLLIAPGGDDAVETVLHDLRYTWRSAAEMPDGSAKAQTWVRTGPRPAVVDVHRTVWSLRAPRAAVWQAFAEDAETLDLAGTEVRIPGTEPRALLLALHACQHGAATPKPLADLKRGLDALDEATWRRAGELAQRLGCADAFATGLRLDPAGVALAARLGLGERARVEVHLRAAGAPATAEGFARLAALPTVRGRLERLARE